MNVKILSSSKENASSNNEDNVRDNNGMQHGTWTKLGSEWPHFPFKSKPGLNVNVENHNNHWNILNSLHLKLLM
jgi:hypothetical protein